MPSEQVKKRLTQSILREAPTLTANICMALFEIGQIYVDAFANHKKFYGIMDKDGKKPITTGQKSKIKQGIKRLISQGLVEKESGKIGLSEIGRKLVEGVLRKQKNMQRKWDGKYRLVVFDIPEKEKRKRHWLRTELRFLGYIPLQKSVYIGKHPLTKDIVKEISKLKLGEYVNYLLVDKVFDERKMRFSKVAVK